ncbi:MAG: hypothetical protein ACE5G1_12085 [bacterium]
MFWSSIILIFLLIGFMLLVAFLPVTLVHLDNLAAKVLQNLPITDKVEVKKDKVNKASDHQSFAFLGQVQQSPNKPEDTKQDAVQKHQAKRTTNLQPKSASHKLSGKNIEEIQGHIPDMQINLAGHSMEDVAKKHGFLLVAATQDKVLGKIIDERFSKMSESELSRYSKRGRSAEALQNYWSIRQAISENLNIPISEIQLLFLVPRAVEQRFVDAELDAIEKVGLEIGKVKLVEAYYDTNLDVRVRSIITEDLTKIEVH